MHTLIKSRKIKTI